jgi:hypothetical protein
MEKQKREREITIYRQTRIAFTDLIVKNFQDKITHVKTKALKVCSKIVALETTKVEPFENF